MLYNKVPPPMRLRADLQQIESLFTPHQAGKVPQHPSSVLVVSGCALRWFFLVVSAIAA